MARLFISHSSHNNDRAVQMRDWLIANGWDDIFLDLDPERGIVAGQRWKEALQKAAYRCEVVLALVSEEWLASGWCKSEIDAARLMGKKIILALIGIDKARVPLDLSDEQWLDLTADPDAYRRLKEGLKRAGLDPSSFPLERGRRPYPGFACLEEKDAAVFFGRDAQIVRGLDKLRRMSRTGVERLLVILGASGSGKSSFLRAGLWPRLKRDDRNWLPLPVIRPERAAISGKFGLVQAIQQLVSEPPFAEAMRQRGLPRSRADIQEFIEKNEDGLARLFAALREIGRVPGGLGESALQPAILLSIDQGEELLNEEGGDEAARFIAILTRTLQTDPRALAVIAMRSDSFAQFQDNPCLAALPKDTFNLDKMLEGSYRAVIEGPARLVEPPLKIDPQLIDALLEDISGQDALPLLAFTLAHLYDNYAIDNALTLEGYERLGRVKGVIDTTVGQAFAKGVANGWLPKDAKAQLALARAAFIPHLAQVNAAGSFVRRVAGRDEIPVEARPVIDCFADQRLLIKDRRKNVEVVEVAHEALLRQAPLSGWLEEDREFLLWRERLIQARAAFEANERELLTGRELQIARRWMRTRAKDDIASPEREFILLSRKTMWRRIRRRSALAGGLALAVTAVLVALPYLKEQWNWFWIVRPYMRNQVLPYVLKPEAERALKPLASFRECAKDCPEMIVVPAGEFTMGSPETEKGHNPWESPQHKVTIPERFAVAKFDVTFAEWNACVSVGGCPSLDDVEKDGIKLDTGDGKKPVVYVSWFQAKQYVEWFSRMTGQPYRLLTEAEWQYATRAGTNTAYYWGDEIGAGNANCDGCGGHQDKKEPTPVGKFAPNAFGLYDMVGNVWQWVEDCGHDDYNGAPTDGAAWMTGECNNRVNVGGSYFQKPSELRSANRASETPGMRLDGVGFRIARTLLPPSR